jgi:non-specific serine/threonine protein kinase
MSAADGPAVAHICRLCEGMPLAIELAAATVRYRSTPQIAGQLQSNWQELAATYSDLPERHQSIPAAFEHSWNLLSAREQELFSKMSLFQGGFDEEASARVTNATGEELSALIDKSLVQRAGASRFTLHPLIKQFAADKLRRLDQYEMTQERHGAYYLNFSEQTQPLLEGESQALWLDRLEAEHDNLRAALNWARANRRVEEGARLAEALSLFWFMRGYLTEGREQLSAFLQLIGDGTAPGLRARLLDRAGFLARYQGDYDGAYVLIGEGLDICRRLGDDHATADALANLGFVVLRKSDLTQARALYAEALAIHRRLDNGQGIADSLSHLALIASFEGDYDAARRDAEESLAIWRGLGDRHGIAWAVSVVAMAVFQQGDLVAAGQHFREGLRIAWEIDVKWEIALSLEGLARISVVQNQPETALHLAGGAAALREAVGVPLSAVESAEFESDLAPAYDSLGQPAASAAWDRGYDQDLGDLVHYALEGMASITDPL